MKPTGTVIKRSAKQDREHKVLLGLVDYYIKTGKPVGSNTLKEVGFADLSSATIRNYFAKLESDGYLTQQHISGGRIPTPMAFRVYAHEFLESEELSNAQQQKLNVLSDNEERELSSYLHYAAETLASLTQTAVFLSAPRFDQDFIVGIRLVSIDSQRCLCILITDFGMIHTEVIYTSAKLSAFSIRRMESYFHWRLTGQGKPENLEKGEEKLAQDLYNELMMRYIVGYSNFRDEDIYRTGFSMLLSYPEFHDPVVLAKSLALFENTHGMRLILKEITKFNTLKFWIEKDLLPYSPGEPNCSVLALPYHIHQQPVGAVGLLGPIRMPYREYFAMLKTFAQNVSKALTRNVYKYKITLRQPHKRAIDNEFKEQQLLTQALPLLLESKI